MLNELLAVHIHQQNTREGVARQQMRDLVKAFRRGAGHTSRSRVETTIESQAVHMAGVDLQQAGW